MERSQVDIGSLTNFLDSIQSGSAYLIQLVGPDQLFFHYTDLGALNDILTEHDIWLTNSRYSNDEEEITLGYEVAKRVTESQLRSAKRRRPRDATRVEFIEVMAELIAEPSPEGFYVCCFCEKDNLLSQWRSYGTRGTGVSLGFDPMEFTNVAGADMPIGLMRLWKVFYKTSTQERIIRSAIDHAYATYQALGVADMAQKAADAIQFFVPTFKNADFREERERRLIFTPYPNCPVKPRYRVARGMLTPYYSIRDLAENAYGAQWRLPLRSVMIGPSAQQALNRESTAMLLQQSGYDQTEVTTSDTPFRG